MTVDRQRARDFGMRENIIPAVVKQYWMDLLYRVSPVILLWDHD